MSLRKFDVFPKLDNEYRVGTPIGGILSILSILSTIILSYIEIHSFLQPRTRQNFLITGYRPTGKDGITINPEIQPHIDVMLNITFPHVPCYLLHLDVIDSFTQLPIPLNRIKLDLQRLSKDGRPLTKLDKNFLNTSISSECFPCEPNVAPNSCCRSCKDVINFYRENNVQPEISRIPQCSDFQTQIKSMEGEGCNVYSVFKVIRVAGEFHIAPGLPFSREGWHVHDMNVFGVPSSSLNLSHIINHLGVFVEGPSDPSPVLDGFVNIQNQSKAWRAVYTLDISNRKYSASRYSLYDHPTLMPGVYFRYDISPISVYEYKEREPVLHLATRLLTVIGGVLGLFRLLDTIFYYSEKKRKQKAAISE
ncbi:endoplasmic reticulum-Golgi intermediate compartment protein 3-like [Histomonas meleagridis]|uniref:endoplasmic reticulum-Golgi intermediate compartment protein 3-like n=1 Tax=Histomonas meleagridis TaxID=135588 RepID=UPI003559D6CB|nr:endoplasmic reticulum-Golgi intermediate compartment protein 3-like [Histomonas meleagridis]KAH0798464.1 endoplasmic reticulum-Golgi intermediate compartment protein 3-like [Histomonas meleagridis]